MIMGNISSFLYFRHGSRPYQESTRSSRAEARGSSDVSTSSEISHEHGQPLADAEIYKTTPRANPAVKNLAGAEAIGNNQTLPTKARVLQVRDEIDLALRRLDDLVGGNTRNTLEESVSLSISLHLHDLHRSGRALNSILSARNTYSIDAETTISSSDFLVEQSRGSRRLPTSDLDDSFSSSLIACSESPSTYSLTNSNAKVDARDAGHSSTPPTVTPPRIAPLLLPRRNISVRSDSGCTRDTPEKSPFDQEIRALDDHINTSLQLSPRTSTNSTQGPRRARAAELRRRLVDSPCPDLPIRRPVSLDGHQAASFLCHRRQFSTEEKTQRLRALRAASTPRSLRVDGSSMGTRPSSEPLMDELMDFLRDGNSLRDL